MSGIGDFIKANAVAIVTGILAIAGAYTAVQVDRALVGRDIEDLQRQVELIDPVQINKLQQFDLIVFSSMQRDIRRLTTLVERWDPDDVDEIREDLQELDQEFEEFISVISQEVKAINNDLAIDYEAIQALTRRMDAVERELNDPR